MRIFDLYSILFLAILFFGVIPIAGAFISRYKWRVFRHYFDDLRLKPFLDYPNKEQTNNTYRFLGYFESADSTKLWIKNEKLTMPILLEGSQLYILPISKEGELFEDFDPQKESPKRIKWEKIALLAEGAKVFVGGEIIKYEGRSIFATTEKHPLLVIFYDENDRTLTTRIIRAGRHKNEYWNIITPYSFMVGFFCLFIVAIYFLSRPVFRFTAITAFIAFFIPFFPLFPPGVIFTIFFRRLWHKARLFRAYRDILRLPLKYMPLDKWVTRLPDGKRYGAVYYKTLPEEKNEIPFLIPEKKGKGKYGYYVFGIISEEREEKIENLAFNEGEMPRKPDDPFAPFGAVLGNPEIKAQNYVIKAYILEAIACILLFIGMVINIFIVIKMVIEFFI